MYDTATHDYSFVKSQPVKLNKMAALLGSCAVLIIIVGILAIYECYNYVTNHQSAQSADPDERLLLFVDDVHEPGVRRSIQVTADSSTPFHLKPTAMLVDTSGSIAGLGEIDVESLRALHTLTSSTIVAETITIGMGAGPFWYRLPQGIKEDGDCAQTTGLEHDLVWGQPVVVASRAFGHVANFSHQTLTFNSEQSVNVSVMPFSGPSSIVRHYSSPEITFTVPAPDGVSNQPIDIQINRTGLYWTTMGVQFQPDFATWSGAGSPKLVFAMGTDQTVTFDLGSSEVMSKSFASFIAGGTSVPGITASYGSALTGNFGTVSWSIDMVSMALS